MHLMPTPEVESRRCQGFGARNGTDKDIKRVDATIHFSLKPLSSVSDGGQLCKSLCTGACHMLRRALGTKSDCRGEGTAVPLGNSVFCRLRHFAEPALNGGILYSFIAPYFGHTQLG